MHYHLCGELIKKAEVCCMKMSILSSIGFLAICVVCISCEPSNKPAELKQGTWRGELDVQGQNLPFNFEVTDQDGTPIITLRNSEERLVLDDISINGDSIFIPMHIFDADIEAIIDGEQITGTWTKNYETDYILNFKAEYGVKHRFEAVEVESFDFTGKWDVVFDHEGDTSIAVAVFEQNENDVTGTFLTPTGDYRYLEGIAEGSNLSLSTFDGGHAFIFKAAEKNGQLTGDFWSGKSWHETWTAVKNNSAKLPDADSLTFLKEGYDELTFRFPDLTGKMVSPQDYKGHALILQIFGTWCPNCMDETKFLNDWYKKNKGRDIEILGIAYEAKDDYEYAKSRVQKMKDKWDIQYSYVIGGHSDKAEAAKTLPMLNHILSFPTTIFIDRNGEVQRIHTGFTGPGTGPYYEQFVKEFNETVDELIGD